MKQLILLSLALKNFRGIFELIIQFGRFTTIKGDNRTGKSTVSAAFYWLLTGKDEFDRKDFEIKNTMKKDLNKLDHSVEGQFIKPNGSEVKLKRIYAEVWQKPKGQPDPVFKGHETKYMINDVPVTATEYQACVDEIIPAKYIKLITNPAYFNSLKWEDQRKGLLSIAGEIGNEEIFLEIANEHNDYASLIAEIKKGTSIEQYKKELAAKRLLLKKAAVEFAPRIDQAEKSKPEVRKWAEIETKIAANTSEIQRIDKIISDASEALNQKNQGVLTLQKEVYSKESRINAIRNGIKTEVTNKRSSGANDMAMLRNTIQNANNAIVAFQKKVTDNATNRKAYQHQIDLQKKTIERLSAEWDAINSEKFSFDESTCTCPTCKQALPAEDIATQKETLLKNFNASKISRKGLRVTESEQINKEIDHVQAKITAIDLEGDYTDQIQVEQDKITSATESLRILQEEDSKKGVENIDIAVEALIKLNAEYLNLTDEITALNESITKQTAVIGDNNNAELVAQKATLQTENDVYKKVLADKDIIARIDAQIEQLKVEESANAQLMAEIERKEFEVQTFSRAKMDLVEQKVNSMFNLVKFRLFETQVNGEIADTCVCELDGVPYPVLNTEAKVTAGMDVLNVLSNFYGYSAPVFVDNRESVTVLPTIDSQVINLFVSEPDKKLRIEAA